jgi:hypothetical protein
MGESGQEPYDLTIRFGKKSIRYYMHGNEMDKCVPSSDNADWITLDKRAKTAVIELL